MRVKILPVFLLIIFAAVMLCASCAQSTSVNAHEPITIMTAGWNYESFAHGLKEKYPEVELEFISYNGQNSSIYMKKTLEAGHIPDIYTSSTLPDEELQKKHLMDLSIYDFSSKYAVSRLKDCSIYGAVYMLPASYVANGIYYNKTLFKKHGWTVPQSFKELEELAPKIRSAGVELSCTDLSFAGTGFQYLFNLADTVFLRTPAGLEWEDDFLSGKASAQAVWKDTVEYVQKWIDLGMFYRPEDALTLGDCQQHFKEGNTAFFLHAGVFTFAQNDDGTGDQYGIMPWLSADGSSNRYITATSRYFGLNAELEKPENKQKLEDAMKFMEFISTPEGQRLLPGADKLLLPLTDDGSQDITGFSDAKELLDSGYSAPSAYARWEKIVAVVGEESIKWLQGESTGEQVITLMEQAWAYTLENGELSYAEVEEDLTNEETAKLVGNAFLYASDADCALVSLGGYHDGLENDQGVNGCLWKGPATNEILCTVCPLGWMGTIQTFTLSGGKIKELQEAGFDRYGDKDCFPYVRVTKGGMKLKDEMNYTVVILGYTDEVLKYSDVNDTGICGMDALKEYFSMLGSITRQNAAG